ncbi:MAG: DUF2845 domain-containing protein [Xanthomonadales bacterium]|jgi:hypothetical protein|nr:DUF2845 domain-containing protein [Xanthomonadales bacterium]
MNSKKLAVLALSVAGICLFSELVDADGYRCGRKIVRTGDSLSRLVQVCGEPRLKSSGSSTVEVDGVARKVRVERWHYKQGSRSLEHVVLIYRGRIAAIELGRR